MKVINLIMISFLLFISLDSQRNYIHSRKVTSNSELLQLIQGRWVLYQNAKEEILIRKDTLFRYFSNNLDRTYLVKISKEIISKIFENDTLKGNNAQNFFEEINIKTGEIENQYSIISVTKNKFVISPIHRSDLLTYNRIKNRNSRSS